MLKRRNPYEPMSVKESLAKEQDRKDIAQRIDTVTKQAAECLDDPKFKKYKDEFEAMRKDVFKKLEEPMYPDPIQDAHYMRSCINTISILDKIITKPEKDTRR